MIAVDLFVVLLVVGGIAGAILAVGGRRQLRQSRRTELVSSEVYKLTRRMAHALESLLIQDANFPILSDSQRSSYLELLKEWEKQL